MYRARHKTMRTAIFTAGLGAWLAGLSPAFGLGLVHTNTATVDMAVRTYDFRDYTFHWVGHEDQRLVFTVQRNSSGVTFGTETGYWKMTRKVPGQDPELILDKDSSDCTVSGGTVTISVTYTEVDDIEPGQYLSQLDIMDSTGTNYVASAGRGTIYITDSLFDD